MAKNPVTWYHLTSLPAVGKRDFLMDSRKKGICFSGGTKKCGSVGNLSHIIHCSCGERICMRITFFSLYFFFTIVAVTGHYYTLSHCCFQQISLVSTQLSPFVPSILSSIPGGEAKPTACVWKSLGGGTELRGTISRP